MYGIPPYTGIFDQTRAAEIMNFQCPTDGSTPCPNPGDRPQSHPSWWDSYCNGSFQNSHYPYPPQPSSSIRDYCDNIEGRYAQNLSTYQQYENARQQQIIQAQQRAAAAKQKAKLDKALIKACKAGDPNACIRLKKMGFKGYSGVSPSAYGAMPPASDEEKRANMTKFVTVMGMVLLFSLLLK